MRNHDVISSLERFLNLLHRSWVRIQKQAELVEQVRRERKELLEMDARGLMDIGIKREDAVREAGRTGWDLPVARLDDLRAQHSAGTDQISCRIISGSSHASLPQNC